MVDRWEFHRCLDPSCRCVVRADRCGVVRRRAGTAAAGVVAARGAPSGGRASRGRAGPGRWPLSWPQASSYRCRQAAPATSQTPDSPASSTRWTTAGRPSAQTPRSGVTPSATTHAWSTAALRLRLSAGGQLPYTPGQVGRVRRFRPLVEDDPPHLIGSPLLGEEPGQDRPSALTS